MLLRYIIFCLVFVLCFSMKTNPKQNTAEFVKYVFNAISEKLDEEKVRGFLETQNVTIEKCRRGDDSVNWSSNGSSALLRTVTENVFLPFCRLPQQNSSSPTPSQSDTYSIQSYQMWLYGLLSVTFINCCAALGVLFIPMIKRSFYKTVMTFMISLAIGSLAGSALLILIPDAMQLAELERAAKSHTGVSYKWRATVVMCGIYLFFLLERFLKWILNRKSKQLSFRSHGDDKQHHGSMNAHRQSRSRMERSESLDVTVDHTVDEVCELSEGKKNGKDNTSVEVVKASKVKVAPIAWMIIFGDALHNFIDGLSIGAAFSRDIFTGLSLSIAVLCEELPHELGDFAILLNAGMTVRKALCWNWISACTCYLGFIIGAVLGELTSGAVWVFAIAGGMFLYISLVDMMPEISALLENRSQEEMAYMSNFTVFVIQNFGLILGYLAILLMSLYGDKIKVSV